MHLLYNIDLPRYEEKKTRVTKFEFIKKVYV